jgi:hypothetical protein
MDDVARELMETKKAHKELTLRRAHLLETGMSDMVFRFAFVNERLVDGPRRAPFDLILFEKLPLAKQCPVVNEFVERVALLSPNICAYLLTIQTLGNLLDWFMPLDMRRQFSTSGWSLMPYHLWGGGTYKPLWPGEQYAFSVVFRALRDLETKTILMIDQTNETDQHQQQQLN